MKTSNSLLIALLCAATLAAAPAMAGFEWRAPDGARVTPTGVQPAQSPMSIVPDAGNVVREKLDLLSPAPEFFKEGISSPPEFAEAPPVGMQYKNLLKAPPPAPSMNVQTPDTQNAETLLAGFGNGLPLGLALNQILPRDYSFSLSQGVDGNQPVSWEGGKPWRVVLEETLSGAGLESRFDGKKLIVRKNPAAPVPVQIVAPMPPPVNFPPLTAEPQMISSIPTMPIAQPAFVAAPVSDSGRVDLWTGLAGQNLKSVLLAWSSRVGVNLVWNSPYDFAIPATFSKTASYTAAVTELLDTYASSNDPRAPKGKLYQGNGSEAAALVIN